MTRSSWRLSVAFTPAAILPGLAFMLLAGVLDGVGFGGFSGGAIALLAVYAANSLLHRANESSDYTRPTRRRVLLAVAAWLLIGVAVNCLVLAVLPALGGLLGAEVATGGAGLVVACGIALGMCFLIGSFVSDMSLWLESGPPQEWD